MAGFVDSYAMPDFRPRGGRPLPGSRLGGLQALRRGHCGRAVPLALRTKASTSAPRPCRVLPAASGCIDASGRISRPRWWRKIRASAVVSGFSIAISRSRRPALLTAGSIHSGWFVAATTTTPGLSSALRAVPRKRFTICVQYWTYSPRIWPRSEMPSSSSMNRMQGACAWACAKTLRIAWSVPDR